MADVIRCPKCGYVRKDGDIAPEGECPACGVIYAKAARSQQQPGSNSALGEIVRAQIVPEGGTRSSTAKNKQELSDSDKKEVYKCAAGIVLGLAGGIYLVIRSFEVYEHLREFEAGVRQSVRMSYPSVSLYKAFGIPGAIIPYGMLFFLCVGALVSYGIQLRKYIHTFGRKAVSNAVREKDMSEAPKLLRDIVALGEKPKSRIILRVIFSIIILALVAWIIVFGLLLK